MARWCLRLDKALSDDGVWDSGCTDEWGTHHDCKGCPHNRYMGNSKDMVTSAKPKNRWWEQI